MDLRWGGTLVLRSYQENLVVYVGFVGVSVVTNNLGCEHEWAQDVQIFTLYIGTLDTLYITWYIGTLDTL